jgi:hypothetical protein
VSEGVLHAAGQIRRTTAQPGCCINGKQVAIRLRRDGLNLEKIGKIV